MTRVHRIVLALGASAFVAFATLAMSPLAALAEGDYTW